MVTAHIAQATLAGMAHANKPMMTVESSRDQPQLVACTPAMHTTLQLSLAQLT